MKLEVRGNLCKILRCGVLRTPQEAVRSSLHSDSNTYVSSTHLSHGSSVANQPLPTPRGACGGVESRSYGAPLGGYMISQRRAPDSPIDPPLRCQPAAYNKCEGEDTLCACVACFFAMDESRRRGEIITLQVPLLLPLSRTRSREYR